MKKQNASRKREEEKGFNPNIFQLNPFGLNKGCSKSQRSKEAEPPLSRPKLSFF